MRTSFLGLLFILLLAPFSKADVMRKTEMIEVKDAWITVVCRLEKDRSYCSLVITRPADSPPIPVKETNLVVFDLAGKPRKLTPLHPDREFHSEAGGSLGMSANSNYLLEGRSFKDLSTAEATYFGQKIRLKFQ